MSEFSSYYLYQKFERRGNQDWIPCIPNTFSISGDSQSPMTITVKSDCDPQCGCSNVQYRWVNLDPSIDWICEGTTKYYKQQRQVSYDGGSTWANLNIYQRGALIDASSSDCTSPSPTIYRWAKTNDTLCIYDGKFRATYLGGTTYELPCDGDSTLTSGNTKPSGYEYTAMTTAEIGDCVTSIGDDAFQRCSGLTSVTIPSTVTSIGSYAFGNCSGLTSVNIPSSVTRIKSSAFWCCTGLTSVIIPNSVTNMGVSVFYFCTNLSSVILPNDIGFISNGTFWGCTSLTSITIPNSVTSIGTYGFAYCYSLTNINIPTSVTRIDDNVFRECGGLTSVTIPSGVTEIGGSAFTYCSSLTSITVNATTPPTLGNNAFYDTNNCPIYVPSGSVNAYKSADGWSDYSSRIQAIP